MVHMLGSSLEALQCIDKGLRLMHPDNQGPIHKDMSLRFECWNTPHQNRILNMNNRIKSHEQPSASSSCPLWWPEGRWARLRSMGGLCLFETRRWLLSGILQYWSLQLSPHHHVAGWLIIWERFALLASYSVPRTRYSPSGILLGLLASVRFLS